jgi:hypothetical protein
MDGTKSWIDIRHVIVLVWSATHERPEGVEVSPSRTTPVHNRPFRFCWRHTMRVMAAVVLAVLAAVLIAHDALGMGTISGLTAIALVTPEFWGRQ